MTTVAGRAGSARWTSRRSVGSRQRRSPSARVNPATRPSRSGRSARTASQPGHGVIPCAEAYQDRDAALQLLANLQRRALTALDPDTLDDVLSRLTSVAGIDAPRWWTRQRFSPPDAFADLLARRAEFEATVASVRQAGRSVAPVTWARTSPRPSTRRTLETSAARRTWRPDRGAGHRRGVEALPPAAMAHRGLGRDRTAQGPPRLRPRQARRARSAAPDLARRRDHRQRYPASTVNAPLGYAVVDTETTACSPATATASPRSLSSTLTPTAPRAVSGRP